jgi:hypothetical protein
LSSSEAYKELQSLEGILPIKEGIEQLLKLVIRNAQLEDSEKPLLDVVLNRVFLGNPGTGMMSSSRIY